MLFFVVLPFIYFTSFREQDKADINSLTPYDDLRQWDWNLRTPACESLLYHCATDADE